MATSVRRDQCPKASVQRSGSEGQCKASINPASGASLRAVNWHGTAKALEAFRTIGRSGGPFRLALGADLQPANLEVSRTKDEQADWVAIKRPLSSDECVSPATGRHSVAILTVRA